MLFRPSASRSFGFVPGFSFGASLINSVATYEAQLTQNSFSNQALFCWLVQQISVQLEHAVLSKL